MPLVTASLDPPLITDRGRLIDSDLDPHALRARHQLCEIDEDADAVKRMLGEDEAVRRIRAIFDEPDNAIASDEEADPELATDMGDALHYLSEMISKLEDSL